MSVIQKQCSLYNSFTFCSTCQGSVFGETPELTMSATSLDSPAIIHGEVDAPIVVETSLLVEAVTVTNTSAASISWKRDILCRIDSVNSEMFGHSPNNLSWNSQNDMLSRAIPWTITPKIWLLKLSTGLDDQTTGRAIQCCGVSVRPLRCLHKSLVRLPRWAFIPNPRAAAPVYLAE